jgi:hypothetical protein
MKEDLTDTHELGRAGGLHGIRSLVLNGDNNDILVSFLYLCTMPVDYEFKQLHLPNGNLDAFFLHTRYNTSVTRVSFVIMGCTIS